MRRLYETRHIPAKHRLSAWLLAAVFALSLCVQPVWASPAERTVIPVGKAVGIKLFSDGVLVVDVSELEDGRSPALQCGIREGDLLLTFNGEKIVSTEHLQELLRENSDKEAQMTLQRGCPAGAYTGEYLPGEGRPSHVLSFWLP